MKLTHVMRVAVTWVLLVGPAVVMAQAAPPAPPLPSNAPPPPSLPAPSNAPPPLASEAPPPSLPAPTNAPPPPSATPPGAAPAYGAPPPAYVPPPPPATVEPPTTSQYVDPNVPPAPPPPAQVEERGPFSRGRIEVTGLIGSTFASHHSYLILGVGVGYFLIDGLQVALNGSLWFLDSPVAGTITPAVNYVLHFVPVLKPYVGVFYRHYIIGDNYKDLNSLGARVGANLLPKSSRSYFGLGAVFETLLDCNSKVRSCNSVYPELTFAISI